MSDADTIRTAIGTLRKYGFAALAEQLAMPATAIGLLESAGGSGVPAEFSTAHMSPGQRLREFRRAREMTAQELADLTGFSRSAVLSHERDIRVISRDAAERYANALGVRPVDIAYGA